MFDMKKFVAVLLLLCLLPLCGLAEMDEDGDVVVTLEGAEFFFTPIVGYCITQESSASVFTRAGFSQRELDLTGAWLMSFAQTIAGGSSEVQLNVIAKRVLGLPEAK